MCKVEVTGWHFCIRPFPGNLALAKWPGVCEQGTETLTPWLELKESKRSVSPVLMIPRILLLNCF